MNDSHEEKSELQLHLIKSKKIVFQSFEDYNIYLVRYTIKLNIKDYILCIYPHLFPEFNIDFFDTFLKYSINDKLFNISLDDLVIYNLIPNKDEKIIIEFINKNKLRIDQDYRIRKLNNKQNNFNKDYRFTPRILKKCLIKNDDKYIDYYLLLENCIKHYIEYQNNLFHKLSYVNDIKLDYLIKSYENQKDHINTIYKDLLSLNNNHNLIYDNLNVAHEKINNLDYSLEKLKINNNIDNNTKLKRSINKFFIYKIDHSKLFIIDCETELADTIIKKNKLKYDQFDLIFDCIYNSKYINLANKLKQNFKDNYRFFNSEILIHNLNPLDEINKIKEYIINELKQYN